MQKFNLRDISNLRLILVIFKGRKGRKLIKILQIQKIIPIFALST